MITVYIKAIVRPVNPNNFGVYAFVAYDNTQKIREEVGVYEKMCTQNQVSYFCLRQALRWLMASFREKEPIAIKTDNPLIYYEMLGLQKASPQTWYYREYKWTLKLASHFSILSFALIPRWQNEADNLAQKAYEEYCRKKGLSLKGPYNGITRLMKRPPWINPNR
ncbi:MAG: hypothetical protein QXQ94_10710 [Candidatus Bathyarchaeia archaeon]